jgi:hypothetical protein
MMDEEFEKSDLGDDAQAELKAKAVETDFISDMRKV